MTTKTTVKCATIDGKALAAMVNLTERRLRQLAEQKRIPGPKRGQWQLEATIKALFLYYQAAGEEYSREKTLKLAAQRKRTELQLERERGKVVAKADVANAIRRIMSPARATLEARLVNEYPSVVAGLEPG